MATIVGELISKNPVELHPVHDQPGYYYVPQRTEFIVKSKYLVCYKLSSSLIGIIVNACNVSYSLYVIFCQKMAFYMNHKTLLEDCPVRCH